MHFLTADRRHLGLSTARVQKSSGHLHVSIRNRVPRSRIACFAGRDAPTYRLARDFDLTLLRHALHTSWLRLPARNDR